MAEHKIKLQIPTLPNYIRSEDGKSGFHISTLTEAELRKIAREWGKALVAKSKSKKE